MPYVLRFTNVITGAEGAEFDSLPAAIARGRKAGFEFSVWRGDQRVASWTVFGGLRYDSWQTTLTERGVSA